uniref:Envelope glycoprotein n=1 Tax=Feline leukemia virus (strain C/Sarma) TaxID=103919 RepID=ENV_FLVSA|nr:RecName: Full=Envelope glycoprotein; AltName: Full=Env polyprotein; Contains: RecName: Full=Surface protein; Short=SU; AltName: Full=Glycoprotein 70; Short=gp70; Contains: RecName: Full=Transmembrane protein; Short=TM; AltName: Full=Envelope protein p15E; Contains: RecName: Full=R-peptide; AltName: Full=p2E; Flags: Precursor [Feline leukemia virus strain C/Sarma]AAA43049.1 envelope protein precursor [Feline leukemia virus]
MESPTHPKPSKDKTFPWNLVFLVGILFQIDMGMANPSPHQVYNVTWVITNVQTNSRANATSMLGTLTDAYPTLYVDLCDLVGDTWEPIAPDPRSWARYSSSTHGCKTTDRKKQQQTYPFYVCPGHAPSMGPKGTYCGGAQDGFCAAWGCETTGEAWWKPTSSWDYITVKRGSNQDNSCKGKCNPLVLQFTQKGRQASWDRPKMWGLRLYRSGYDPIALFSVSRQVMTITPPQAMGPNLVLPDQKPPSRQSQTKSKVTTQRPQITSSTPRSVASATMGPKRIGTGDRLINLVQGTYLALNATDPNKTKDCWLCLVSRPPYYEGIAVLGNYSNQTNPPPSCLSTPQHKLTISEVSGQGLCIGTVPKTHQALCKKTQKGHKGTHYLAAPNGTYWACNTGLTPCISMAVLNWTSDFCVLIELWPRVTYHQPEYIYTHFDKAVRFRREPISLTVALMLGGLTVGGIAAGVGTGTKALLETAQFRQLQIAMHTDIQALEESISALEKSLTSLSEVVLQNRRGLDILFLQEGGLCAALKEECCFYADHTGLVRDNMAKLRERLKQRQQLFDSQQGWFEGWFNKSPWFTTLISSIMGPLLILLLILLLGPCILNRLVQFVKDRISVVQALILTQQYQQIQQYDSDRP